MRGLLMILLAVPLAAAAWEFDVGAGSVTIDGQLRARVESRDNGDLNRGRDDNLTQLLTRTRLGLTWRPDEHWSVRLLGQDSRSWDPVSPKTVQDELELHEGFVTARFDAWTVTGGRQPLAFADQRLVGTFEWSNVTRRFDALRVAWQGSSARVDLFGATLGNSPGTKGLGGEFYGVWATLPQLAGAPTDLFALYNYQSLPGAPNVLTVGGRRQMTFGAVRTSLQAAGQFGDITAFMAVLEAGLPLGSFDLSGVFAVASGDAGGDTFRNLYPTNHGFYGYLDYQGLQNVLNAQARVSAPLRGGSRVEVQYNSFWLYDSADAWYGANGLPRSNGVGPYRDPAGASGRHVGQEVDLALDLRLGRDVTMQVGYGHFFAGGFVERVNAAAGVGTGDSDFLWWQCSGNW